MLRNSSRPMVLEPNMATRAKVCCTSSMSRSSMGACRSTGGLVRSTVSGAGWFTPTAAMARSWSRF